MQVLIDFIYQFFVEYYAKVGELLLYIYFKMMLFLLDVFWQMAKDILAFYDVTAKINYIFSFLDPRLSNIFAFFKVQECIHLIASAKITRYLFSFIPFA